MSKVELVDWYKKIPKKFLPKQHNPCFQDHHITLPFRMIIVGSSGSGKTQTLLNLLNIMPNTFEKIRIITKCKSEPLYEWLEEKLKDFDFKIEEGLGNLPDLDSLDKTVNNLIVLDDLVNEPTKQQRPICDYFIRARKKNCSIIYISQSYYAVPQLIRQNINYLIIKQIASLRNLTMIMRECSLGIDKKDLKKIYDDATQSKQDFLLIDIDGQKDERFRKNFSEIYVLDDDFK